MSGFLPGPQDLVEHVMRRWPATLPVFARHGLACIGCAFAEYHTVGDGAAEHGLAVPALLRDLRESVMEAYLRQPEPPEGRRAVG